MKLQSLGEQLRVARDFKNWSLRELEEVCGVSASHISRIEREEADPKLDVVLKICNALDCDLNVISRKPRLLRTDHPLITKILTTLEPQKSDRTYAKLFGAVVALLTDWEIILRHPIHRLSRETADYLALLPDLRQCIEEQGGIDWEFSSKFIPWSKGFFRNDAQQRLALVLNRCAFWWLVAERPNEKDHWSKKSFLEWLEALHQPLSDDLLDILNTSGDMNDAKERVSGFASPYKPNPDVTSVEELVDHADMPSEVECAAIVYRLIDTALTVDEQYGWAYDIEWAVTAKALIWIGAFRQTMLQRHPNIKLP